MAFDGGFTAKIIKELSQAKECHIDKIYQPSKDELVFLLRKKGFVKRLFMSARSGAARVHFTENKTENPAEPPMFCMLARKYFSSARLVDVRGRGFDRIIEFVFETSNEMGDRVTPKIICELIGNQSNIILIGENGKIIDAIKRSDIETAKRIIQPSAKYEYPKSLGKINPKQEDINIIAEKILSGNEQPLWKAVLNTVDGMSPLICREIAYRVCSEDVLVPQTKKQDLNSVLCDFVKYITDDGCPTILYGGDGNPAEFSYIDIKQYGSLYKSKVFSSYSELLDAFYTQRENTARIRKASADITKLLNNLIARTNRRLSSRLTELEECKDREKLRIYGELIKANIHLIENGSEKAVVQNFYDENLSSVEIPLNPAISVSANASNYFKEYKKSYTAEQTLTKLTKEDREELEYFDSVLDSLSRSTSFADIEDIRNELINGGYIKTQRHSKKQKKQNISLKEFISKEGYRILVGKNNVQNDYITTVLAKKSDLWFHVKGIHGSHVVVFCDGNEVSDETLYFAACLAAKNSKAENSSNVPVDYTPVKYVKKPSGAKSGMVIYTTNKTLFVTPREEIL